MFLSFDSAFTSLFVQLIEQAHRDALRHLGVFHQRQLDDVHAQPFAVGVDGAQHVVMRDAIARLQQHFAIGDARAANGGD